MIVQFGRVHRGIVWHVLAPSTGRESVMCGEDAELADVVQAHALRRGRVCPRCAAAVDDLWFAVERAATELPEEGYQGQLTTRSALRHTRPDPGGDHLGGRTVEDVAPL